MDHSRRHVLAVLAFGSATALAGCADDGGDGTPTTEPGNGDGADAATVTVAPGGSHVFDPADLVVDVGATVTFVWDADGHNVAVTNQPDGADWDGESTVSSAGHEHAHTFDVEGRYEYQCDPHAGSGMRGTITVGDAEAGNGGNDDGTDGGY